MANKPTYEELLELTKLQQQQINDLQIDIEKTKSKNLDSIFPDGKKYLLNEKEEFNRLLNLEQVKTIFQAVPVPMMLLDDEVNIISVNKAILRDFKVSLDEVINKKPGDAFNCVTKTESFANCGNDSKCDLCGFHQKTDYAIKTGNRIRNNEVQASFYFDYIKHDLWFDLNIEPIKVNSKNYALITLSNITKIKNTETSLAGALSHIQMIVSKLPLVLWTTDTNLNFTFSDGAGLKDINLSPNEVVTKQLNLYQYFQTNSDEVIPIKKSLEALEGEKSFFEYELSDTFWQCYTEPVYNDLGVIIGTLGMALNITEKKHNEKELAEYRKHLEELVKIRTDELTKQNNFQKIFLDTIPNPVFVKNRFGQYTEVNKAFLELFNVEKEEIIGQDITSIAAGEVVEISQKEDYKLFEDGGTSITETSVNKNDDVISMLEYKASFGSEENQTEGIAGILVDISERKKMEEKIYNSLKKEQELNEMKTNFISMASHEFRTPLTSILSAAEMLELFGKEWPIDKCNSYLKKIQNSVMKMKELLNDVLEISKTERGAIKLDPQKNNLYETTKDVIENIHKQYPSSHKIKLNINTEFKEYVFDKTIITHILENLISNAIKYSPDNSTICIEINNNDEHISFTVLDQGYGIPEEDLKKIFEPFFRSKNCEMEKGSGLGLAIVKRYVEMHNGIMNVKSELNKYTRFYFEIPIKNQASKEAF